MLDYNFRIVLLVEVEQRQELHHRQRQRILLLPLILLAEQRLMHEGVMVSIRCLRPVVKEGGGVQTQRGIPTSHPTQEHAH